MKKALLYTLTILGVGVGGFLSIPSFALADHANTHNQTLPAGTTTKSPGMYTWGNLTIPSGATLLLQGDCLTDTGVTINANNITVAGTISANGQGCAGGASAGIDGTGLGGGGGASGGGNGGGGGGYGGAGGRGGGSSFGAGGPVYGSSIQPTHVGSGGGGAGGGSNGGTGGGAIKLIVKDVLTVGGTISSNGGAGGSPRGGGGSGGSIWIITGTFEGAGAIIANGGNGGGSGANRGGGGGGGRIAIYYYGKTFTPVPGTSGGSTGGSGGAVAGSAGTVDDDNSYGNVTGWAWSSNIGWISLNCYTDTNGTTPEIDHTCATAVYGVTVAMPGGAFSGYAWSEHIGWVRFDAGASAIEPPAWSACLDLPSGGEVCNGQGNYTISGWVRALAFASGWDGWIKMRGTVGIPYGVVVNNVTKELSGWAWGGDVVGWVSFNCSTDPGCNPVTSDYAVLVDAPLDAPKAQNLAVVSGNYCPASSPPITLNWIFTDSDAGAFQSAYEVQIDDDPAFASPFGSGVVSGPSTAYAPPSLAYGTTYYWRVMVWDDINIPSPWAYPPSPAGGAPPTASPGTSFATAAHAYPKTGNFDWSPKPPAAGEVVQFQDGNPFDPASPPASRTWKWDFTNNGSWDAFIAAPTTIYPSNTTYSVEFEACDDVGCCNSTKSLPVSIPFPGWIEISPF